MDVKPNINTLNSSDSSNLVSSSSSILNTNRMKGSSRLPSFRGPRDLSLGSVGLPIAFPSGRQKKNFVPNIPIKREKGENVIADSRSEKMRKENIKKLSKSGRGRVREKEYVQIKGSLLGEGMALPFHRDRNSFGRGGGGKGGSDPSVLQRPTLNTDAAYNVDKAHEDLRLEELHRGDFIDYPDDFDSECRSPVQLPMVHSVNVLKSEKNIDLDTAVKIKVEPECSQEDEVRLKLEDINMENKPAKLETDLHDKNKPAKENNIKISELFKDGNSSMMFLQLPSSLPCHPPEIKQEADIQTSESLTETKASLPQKGCSLTSLPEGQIGKLRVMKSGRTELWLGKHKLNLAMGTQVGFLQDVVSIVAKPSNDSSIPGTGSMHVLGHVSHRIVATPDFDSLVKANT